MTDDTGGRECTREEATEGPAFRGRRSTNKPANSPFLSAPATSLIDPVTELEKEPRILDKFVFDAQQSGLVGEERGAKILFLALTSRLLKRPVSVAIKGAVACHDARIYKKQQKQGCLL